ncbi:MAG: quinoprotein relay system zinc metallohydrolase 1 [Gammaproteobacteria bacterium]
MRVSCLFVLCVVAATVAASDQRYRLAATRIAPDTWLVRGSTAHFSMANGGNIANCAFIATGSGAVVIDTGPSARYGEALRALVEHTTGEPVVRVYNTHHHPDHFLGNQAFAGIPIHALPDTRRAMAEQAEAFSDNLYRLLGTWMKGTVPHLPTVDALPGEISIGSRRLELFAYRGHTAGDLVILDHATGTLFVGDLVFNHRAPTTPNADLAAWQSALQGIAGTPFERIVPGHGDVAAHSRPISETADYLQWLAGRIDEAVGTGRSMAETLFLPIPRRFDAHDTLVEEYRRSVMHLYPGVEHAFFHAE